MRRAFQFGLLTLAAFWPVLLMFAPTLGWDLAPGASGAWLYSGGESHVYTNRVDVGTNRTLAVSVPSPRFYALAGYGSNGIEADFSAELAVVPRPYALLLETSVDPAGPWRAEQIWTFTNYSPQQFWRLRVGQ